MLNSLTASILRKNLISDVCNCDRTLLFITQIFCLSSMVAKSQIVAVIIEEFCDFFYIFFIFFSKLLCFFSFFFCKLVSFLFHFFVQR